MFKATRGRSKWQLSLTVHWCRVSKASSLSPRFTPLLYRTASSCMACSLQCACVKRQWHSHSPYCRALVSCEPLLASSCSQCVLMHGLQVIMCVCETAMAAVSVVVCSLKYTRGQRKTFQSFTGQPQRHSTRQNEGNQSTVS